MRSKVRPIVIFVIFATATSLLTACAAAPSQSGSLSSSEPPASTQPSTSGNSEPTTAPTASSSNSLDHTIWNLVSYGKPGSESQIIAGSKVTLELNAAGRASGNGGCNKFNGSYVIKDNTIKFDQIISTLMACADQQVTQQEQGYLQALNSATKYDLQGDQLTIFYGTGEDTLHFKRAGSESTPTGQ